MKFTYDPKRSFTNKLYVNRIEIVDGLNELPDTFLNHRTIKQLIELKAVELINEVKAKPVEEIPQEEVVESVGEPPKRNSRRSRSTVEA